MIINGQPLDLSEWINIDGSRIFGVEVEGEVAITDNLRIRGFYAYTDSSLGDLLAFNAANPHQQWINVEDEDVPVSPVNLGGNPFPSLAAHQFAGTAIWTVNDTAYGNIEVATTYGWVGDRQGAIWNLPLDEMPAYGR